MRLSRKALLPVCLIFANLASTSGLKINDTWTFAQGKSAGVKFNSEGSHSDFKTCFSDDKSQVSNCIQVNQAQLNQPYHRQFNRSLEFRFIYSYNDPNLTFSVVVQSPDAIPTHPIIFVVRQQKAVTSWELPFVLESSGHKQRYQAFERTICPLSTDSDSEQSSSLVVDISTSSRINLTFSITVSVQNGFDVGLEDERQLRLTPSENKFFKFSFPPDVHQVAVVSKSLDDVCMIVSVQSPQCPVFDTIYNVEYEGFRQTMTGQSNMIVQKSQYPDGFFLVYIVNIDDAECLSPDRIPSNTNQTKELSFKIQKTISISEFRKAIFLGTLGVYGIFITLVIATCFLLEYKRRHRPDPPSWDFKSNRYQSRMPSISELPSITSESDTFPGIDKEQVVGCYLDSPSTTIDDVFSDVIEAGSKSPKPRTCRMVSEMAKEQPDYYNKKSKRYVSELCVIAVFYLIPVGQLVHQHRNMMMKTGDQDLCYYNFACAHPYRLVMDFSDFNHFFSNIGYIILGAIFLLITKRRDYLHGISLQKNSSVHEHGIPPHYGLCYAMGGALIVEGILSACYHICPTRVNFQFDTSFMYVIAVLCTLKLYHARHADVNAKSYTTYCVLAFIVLLGASPVEGEFYTKLCFTFFHLIGCIGLSVDIYYMGHCEWLQDKKCHEILRHCNTCWRSSPLYIERLILVIFGTCVNIIFAATELAVNSVDFNTHILVVFMINLFIYSIFYIVMKWRKKEYAARHPFLYLIAAFVFWFIGSYFFLQKSSKWEFSPAESRMLNLECIVGKVYDTHDLWHFFSSTALFFYFMFLLTLDDDIESKPRREIPVF